MKHFCIYPKEGFFLQRRYDVICVGQLCADILVRPVNEKIFTVDSTPVDSMLLWPGGDAQNESCVMAKLGMKTALVGKIGHDIWGDAIVDIVTKSGVDLSHVVRDDTVNTCTSVALIFEDGRRNFLYQGGGNDAFTADDIDFSLFSQTRLVTLGSLFSLPGLLESGFATIVQKAHEAGALVSADTAQVPEGYTAESIRPIIQDLDYFMPSYEEASKLVNSDNPETIVDRLKAVCRGVVILKHGGDGCYVSDGQQSFHMPPFKVNAIDTTGAGDNFTGGFMTAVLKGFSLRECARFANATGAISVQSIGTTTAIQNFQQVMDFLAAHPA